jgi:hypothetical protein
MSAYPFSAPGPASQPQSSLAQAVRFAATLPKATAFFVARSLLWLLLATAFGCVEAIVFVTERLARLPNAGDANRTAETVTRSGS